MQENLEAIILVSAAMLDYLLGDPWGWIHPVQVMGWSINYFTQWSLERWQQKWPRRYVGILLGLVIIFGSGAIAWGIVQLAKQIHPLLGIMVEIVLLASCFAGKSLRKAAQSVLNPLNKGEIEEARTKLSQFVGRDTEQLSVEDILRATLESVAENTIDGVTSPLFYAILGAFFFPIGSVPLAIAYKAASTLDSMIGYLREPYTDIGWFSDKF